MGERYRGAAPIRLERRPQGYPGGTVAVDDLTLEVPAGELVVLVGPSGCGKSTMLRMVNRLIEPTSGRIFLGDEEITQADPVALRRRIGYVIQNVGLFPHQTVRAERGHRAPAARLDQGPHRPPGSTSCSTWSGWSRRRYAGRYPHELSGGQRQRVGVARALAADPVVLLMDEPFSAVDPIVRARLQEEFLRLQATVRKTIVFVTHDVDEAVRLGDRIAVLSEGGQLEQYAPRRSCSPSPPTTSCADFVGADRGIKRLAVTGIPMASLRPLPDGGLDGGPTVDAGATLRDALAALLEGGTGWVAVTQDGSVRGVLTPDDIYTALRAQ